MAPRALGIQRLAISVARRLMAGEHLVMWGPTGGGKTTLLAAIESCIRDRPCARADHGRSLDDITRALEQAYPSVQTADVARRTARARLWDAADRDPAILLLDDVGRVSTAMKGFLRRLRGGIAGVLLVFDVDTPRERARLREQHLACTTLRIPPLCSRLQATLLRSLWKELPVLSAGAHRRLIRAARGRPGWLIWCATLARDSGYWRAGIPKLTSLAVDTELRLRASRKPLEAVAMR